MPVDHYENFPVASWLCPPALRPAVEAIYRFARTADDLADEGDAPPAERRHQLDAYESAFRAALEGSPTDAWHSVFAPLTLQMHLHALPTAAFLDLLSAFRQDTDNPHYADRAHLLDYCERSANPIGRLLLCLVGLDEPEALQRADAVCTALQLINFWQDLSVDLPRGRCYVPHSDAQRHGLSLDTLQAGEDTPATCALVADLVGWSRSLMLEGAPLALQLPGRFGWELRFVVQGGLRILDKIERSGFRALSHRPTVGATDAPLMVWRALRMRPAPRTAPDGRARRTAT